MTSLIQKYSDLPYLVLINRIWPYPSFCLTLCYIHMHMLTIYQWIFMISERLKLADSLLIPYIMIYIPLVTFIFQPDVLWYEAMNWWHRSINFLAPYTQLNHFCYLVDLNGHIVLIVIIFLIYVNICCCCTGYLNSF